MKRDAQRFFLTALIAAAGGLLSLGFGPVSAQAIAPEARHSAPQDWSHRHLLYPNPDTRDEAARKGTLAFERWKQNHKDPRFALQVARKARFVQTTDQSPFSPQQQQWANRHRRDPPPAGPDIHQDWSNVLGGATGVGRANVFPAKFNFDIDAAPSCANDFVVYTTASSGASSSGTFARQTGAFSRNPGAGATVTITRAGSPALVITASTTLNLGLNYQIGTTTTITATNLANAITRNGGTAGVTATSATNVVTVAAITTGATGANTTLASSSNRFTWAGTTLTNPNGTGTAGQPTIVAFNQLYEGTASPACGTTATQNVPATFWSYNTGTGAFAETSPVLSLDGTQVAFVQRTGTAASLVVLKWSSAVSVGTVGAPTAPTSVTPANYRTGNTTCTAPCMTVIPFSGNPNNTNSSPYYVYYDDVLYVGADNGTLHKFTGVFAGTPAEVTTAGWPVTVSTGNMLTSPVYDANGSGLIFLGSDTGTSSGGQLHSVDPRTSSPTVVSSGQLAQYNIVVGGANTTGVRDAPIVDWAAQRVYTFVESDTSQACNTAECKAIYQFPTNSSIAGLTSPKVQIGRGQIAARILYAGTFDDAYYTSANAASPTGNLYVCGTTSGTTISTQPTLWKIPITSNVMGAPVVGPTLVSGTAECSPITEVMNGTNDYIYVSVSALGNKTGCTGTAAIGCVYLFNLTGVTWGTGINANAGIQATGGTGGIVIDNISSTTGASQIYYSTLTSPGNAVQASQAALQ